MLGVNPILLLILAVIFFGILYLTKYVSLSSIIAAISCVIGSLVIHDYILFGMSAFVSIILIFRHRSNIVRIFKGEEPKSNGCKMDVSCTKCEDSDLVLLIKYDKQFMFNSENNMF